MLLAPGPRLARLHTDAQRNSMRSLGSAGLMSNTCFSPVVAVVGPDYCVEAAVEHGSAIIHLSPDYLLLVSMAPRTGRYRQSRV